MTGAGERDAHRADTPRKTSPRSRSRGESSIFKGDDGRWHRVVSRALKVATQRGKVARNVATLVDPPTVRRPDTALPLSAQEAKRVMATAQSQRNAARWTVALAVGLRQSEALALRWADINL